MPCITPLDSAKNINLERAWTAIMKRYNDKGSPQCKPLDAVNFSYLEPFSRV